MATSDYMLVINENKDINYGSMTVGLPGGSGLTRDAGYNVQVQDTLDDRLLTTFWDDVQVPGLATRLGSSAPDLVNFSGSSTVKIIAFDGGSLTEEVYFDVQLPHRYRLGSDIYPHVHWTPTTTGSGYVNWQLEYSWSNVNGTFDSPVTIQGSGYCGDEQWKHKVTGLSSISGVDKNISSMLVCRLFRDPSEDDTYEDDAGFLEFDVHYEVDSPGSRQQYIK